MIASLTLCLNQLEGKGKLASLTYLSLSISEVDLYLRSLLVIVLDMYYVLNSHTNARCWKYRGTPSLGSQEAYHTVLKVL